MPRPLTLWTGRRLFILMVLATLALGGSSSAVEPSPAETVAFNRDVLPILAESCFACHGFDKEKREAGLRLDQRSGSTQRLESGAAAIVPGEPDQSELWRRIASDDPQIRMPPPNSGSSLTDAQRTTLRRWIEQGAAYEPHWALVPPRAAAPPTTPGATQPIDRFVRQRLLEVGLAPSPPASRETLVRRVTLDLTGLPPTPLEVDAFVHDARADAYERVVRRLLQSEHFGERWARWWLDLAHYGDSDGYLQDFLRPVAWRYRQWVVDSLNRDKPFDQFSIEQLAGDLMPNATLDQRMGTGFWRNTLSNREGGADLEEFRVYQVLDRTATFGTTWLGLTVACAQCHDHKYDALTQREFYQLYAFFNDADEANFNAPLPGELEAWLPAKREYDRQRTELLAGVQPELAALQADWERRILHTESHPGEDFAWDRTLELLGLQWGQNLGEGQLEGLNIIKTPVDRRTPDQQQRLQDYFLQAAPAMYQPKFQELKVGELRGKLDALAKTLPPITRAPGMVQAAAPRTTRVFIRGEWQRLGEVVAPGTPAALPPLSISGPPDRLALARWMFAPDQPLIARVAVNRIWQELLGRGFVATSENLGVRGDRPSHPELLDWLAVRFREQGWSMKSLIREIVLSETYQQSSVLRPDLAERDPANRWLARQSRLRLPAELVRDEALAVSGLLNRTVGGPSVKPPQPASVSKEGYANVWAPSAGADRYRRGLYTFLQRTSPFAQFVTFDLPDLSRSCTRRERSNTPLQALQLLNDPVFLDAARALARRVHREAAVDDDARLEHAVRLTLCRAATHAERRRLSDYLVEQRRLFAEDAAAAAALTEQDAANPEAAWVALASVLLNLDEFLQRE
ncbi:MAG: PSD1 and planctomycete cytochrome C domain-containing protein [Pirellulales bacterium]